MVAYETPQVAEGHWEVLHSPLKARSSVCFKPLITNGIELAARIVIGVCDNQWAFARKLLILKRRDVRVVEGARLEIALAVCDGVLQISITVAKPTT